jgi:hypothetical protein
MDFSKKGHHVVDQKSATAGAGERLGADISLLHDLLEGQVLNRIN